MLLFVLISAFQGLLLLGPALDCVHLLHHLLELVGLEGAALGIRLRNRFEFLRVRLPARLVSSRFKAWSVPFLLGL